MFLRIADVWLYWQLAIIEGERIRILVVPIFAYLICLGTYVLRVAVFRVRFSTYMIRTVLLVKNIATTKVTGS